MAGFADFVLLAQPVLVGDYAFDIVATQGADWLWEFIAPLDEDGAVVDLSGVTGVCKVLAAIDGTEIATLTFAGAADGTFALSLDGATTAGIDPGSYVHYLRVSQAGDVVQFWGPTATTFTVLPD